MSGSYRFAAPLHANGYHFGFRGWGVLGSLIPADVNGDTSLQAFGRPSVTAADLESELQFAVTRFPEVGEFFAYEDSSFNYSGPTTTFDFIKRRNGVQEGGTATAFINMGVGLVRCTFPQSYVIEGAPPALVMVTFPQAYIIESEITVSFIPSAARTLRPKAGSREFTGGVFWDLSDPTYPLGFKDIDDQIDITIDWTDVLADIGGDTIASAAFTPGGGLEAIGPFANGPLTSVSLRKGGNVNQIVDCKVHIVTGSTPPREHDLTFFLAMRVA